MRRRTRNNKVAADLMKYLIEKRGMTQNDIADVLGVDKSFVSRVAAAERDLSTHQLRTIADALDVPMGALLLDALGPTKTKDPEKQKILDLTADLMQLADKAVAALRAERAAKAASKRTA
ncbi:MAG: helix-turn-helix transcriptional regulator [Tepidisphaeraceae bacterium]